MQIFPSLKCVKYIYVVHSRILKVFKVVHHFWRMLHNASRARVEESAATLLARLKYWKLYNFTKDSTKIKYEKRNKLVSGKFLQNNINKNRKNLKIRKQTYAIGSVSRKKLGAFSLMIDYWTRGGVRVVCCIIFLWSSEPLRNGCIAKLGNFARNIIYRATSEVYG